MSEIWLKIKVWTKVIVFSAALIYALLFIFNNSGKPTEFWYWFGHTYSTSVFFLTTGCFVAGILVTLMVRTSFTTLRQIRTLQERNRVSKAERQCTPDARRPADDDGGPSREIEERGHQRAALRAREALTGARRGAGRRHDSVTGGASWLLNG
jgi:uncharacterized integral membrane protein